MGNAIVGRPKSFHHRYKFQLELDGFDDGVQFQSCSELKGEVAKIEYYEGGVIIPYKEAGRMTFSDITLERGVTSDSKMYDWFVDTANAAMNSGLASSDYKRGGSLVQYSRDNSLLRSWRIYGAWPTSFTAGTWDNTADEVVIEQIVLCIDYFTLERNVSDPTKRLLTPAQAGFKGIKALG